MLIITPQQLAEYLYGDETQTGRLPVDAGRLLGHAYELVQDHTITAFYSVDSTGVPTDAGIATAFRDSICAQVEFWLAGDEEDDILGPLQGASAGSQQQQYGAGANRATPMYLAPRAARRLRLAGLMDAGVQDAGSNPQVVYGDALAEFEAGLG